MAEEMFEATSTYESWMYPGGPVFSKGSGVWVWDEKGDQYFDGTGGSGALNLGHSHPRVNEAIINQLGKITHTGCKVQSSIRQEFISRLAGFFPLPDVRILPTVTGAETVEAGIKIARAYTGKKKIMTFDRSYHGKTTGALSLTWSADIKKYSPINMEDVVNCPAPVLYDHHVRVTVADCLNQAEDIIIKNEKAKTPLAAIIIEPVQATEGVLELSAEFLEGLQTLASKHNILYIWDEIYTGLGRTGTPFYFQQFNVSPDLVLVGKALANGLPIGSVIGNEKIMNALPAGIQTSTFSGHPLASAAALEALAIFESENIWNTAQTMGSYLRQGLDTIHEKYQTLSKSRGPGLMIGFDCLDEEELPSAAVALNFAREMIRNKVLVFKGGYQGASIRLTPTLLITKAEADHFLSMVEKSCETVCQTFQKKNKYAI